MAEWHNQRPRFVLREETFSGESIEDLRRAAVRFSSDVDNLWHDSPTTASSKHDTIREALKRKDMISTLAGNLNNIIAAAISTKEHHLGELLEQRSKTSHRL